MVRRSILVALGALTAIAAIAVTALHLQQDTVVAQPAAAVSIKDFAFNPATITVATGTTVRWSHDDAAPHTVTSGAPDASNKGEDFDSGRLTNGGMFAFTFTQEGTFPYFCEIHPRMIGMVEVTAGAVSPPSGGTPGAPIPNISVVGRDFSFDAPDTVPSGAVSITFTNEGAEPHHGQIFRLNDGVTQEQLFAAFMESEGAALALGTLHGGPGTIGRGGRAEVVQDLPTGQYLFLCFIAGADDVPHIAKGMVKPFTVTASATPAAPPAADGEAEMFDFAFRLPEFRAGPSVVEVVNLGPQYHEMNLLKLAEGKELADVFAFFAGQVQGPPPFSGAGGMQGLEVNGAGWVKLDLTPGNYVAICNIPDPETGKSHAELGMVSVFTVQ
jgi:plastocyanin